MAQKPLQSHATSAVIMIGAGVCAALLFAVARQGTPQAMAIAYLTPLPIMIATLGFGAVLGFGSALVGALTVAFLAILHHGVFTQTVVIAGLLIGLIFAISQALPAWWLAFLACLARPGDSGHWHIPPASQKMPLLVFYPIGRILVHAAIIVICLMGLAIAAIAVSYGSLDSAIDKLTGELSPWVDKLADTYPELPSGFDVQGLTRLIVKIIPAIIAASSLMMFLANLWLAGRVVQTSNKLPRPWPNIAQELRLPRVVVLGLAAAIGLCFVKGWPGTMGLICAVTIGMIYALQGIAVVHELTRGSRWRTAMLVGIYATLILMPWPLALFALLGLADTAFSLRDRKAATLSAQKP